ncbi:hypothetical protein P175DRAFT_0513571 [Aspergillus ochraceoroseus IBT 24754]|uniref:67 kDa myosin-cross-reactive antigen family protein n=3 Tax=Aspergillus subgen. Nidulantes TaxID=2720870 RepID=A0A0F8WPM7_9EURO|nr:uncharacterized protein P175DRAFT_0513571 [Aspergillus ochraceoroseus IBT 24754]KKK13207.1 hypothetical protein ARAM_000543 [Aspergillus rambellii]KKK22832.1 hypothetical protein AOCH_003836 [Aspergillus ochraceoroseus]PTU24647.1 hypothetical protein P175DRAFT_0513571 [Aspergillus ochraceoroseus IBT 24754]
MSIRQPDRLDAWILGSGIASLTAAVHLLQEAQVPPSRIHIVETLGAPGGTTTSFGDAEHGYDYRGGVRPQFNDICMDALLSLVPSKSNPKQTLRDDILQHAESHEAKGHTKPAQTRFVERKPDGISRVDAKKATLGLRDRIDLFMLASKTEKALGRAHIRDFFNESFFHSGYWLTLATTFGFKPSHSAAEFSRYLHRFNNLHDLQRLHPLDAGKYNVHESIINPIVEFLHSKGVDFHFNTTVCDVIFAYDKDTREPSFVTAIRTAPAHERSTSIPSAKEKTIFLKDDDFVMVNLGSIYSSILHGDNTHPPPCLEHIQSTLTPDTEDNPIDTELDENWLLWLELSTKHSKFGNAYNFCTRLHDSRIESFTITLHSPEFFTRLTEATGNAPGPTNILTLRDSSWLITLRIPSQPVFPDQPDSVQVCCGYALFPEKNGDYLAKPMLNCSGQEILSEILHHLQFPIEPITSKSITIPCIQPRAAATLLPRVPENRPHIIPPGVANMAMIGPFVNIPDEVVVTADYSVRGAQMAVRHLMKVDRLLKKSKRTSAINLLGLL